MATSLLDLPPELLLRISSYLTTPELGPYRRTCKQVESALFDSFAREFFTKRQFAVELVSLQALVDIANHPTLSSKLSELIISNHAFADDSFLDGSSTALADSETGYVSREILISTGKACDMLVEAFTKLSARNPRLRVGLRDFDGGGRFRDGEDAQWRSYGWSCWRQPTAVLSPTIVPQAERTLAEILANPDQVFTLVLYALGTAQARPDSIEVFLRKTRLSRDSFDIVGGYMGAAIKPVLADLRVLMLNIGNFHQHGGISRTRPRNWNVDLAVRPLKRFLKCSPNLETLRLNFTQHDDSIEAFLKWFAEPSTSAPALLSTTTDIAPVQLRTLQCLDLGALRTYPATLVDVITKFDLISVSLWRISLMCKDDDEFRDAPDRWSAFFSGLSDALPSSTRINHFLAGHGYQQGLLGRYASQVKFAADGDPDNLDPGNLKEQITFQAEYGSSVKLWLKETAGRTCVPELRQRQGSHPTDDEEDSSDLDDGPVVQVIEDDGEHEENEEDTDEE